MSSTREQLRSVLIDLELISKDETVQIRRCYPGLWQRSAGAWSWYAQGEKREVCGSQFSMKQIVEFHRGKNGYKGYKVCTYFPPFATCPELIPEKVAM